MTQNVTKKVQLIHECSLYSYAIRMQISASKMMIPSFQEYPKAVTVNSQLLDIVCCEPKKQVPGYPLVALHLTGNRH